MTSTAKTGILSRFPLKKEDLWKIVPMFMMLFLICINYSILRNLKDAVVVTAHGSGAEAIPFIKVWFMLPMAFLLTVLFTKLSNKFSQERVFYIIIGIFISFYALFGFVLYPLHEVLHPNQLADNIQMYLPVGSKGLIAAFRNWTFTGFYVMAELWGSMVLTVLFWTFANEVTKVSEARYFYSILGVASNVAAYLAGQIGIAFSIREFNASIPFGSSAWEQSLMSLVLFMIGSGFLTMAIFWWMNRYVLNKPEFDKLHSTAEPVKQKKKMSVRESFAYLSRSKYLFHIAILVLSYNLVINMVEIIWKAQLKELYPKAADFNVYMNQLTSTIGIISTVIAVFMPLIIKWLGWTKTALLTPITMLVTSIGFFVFYLGNGALEAIGISSFVWTPLMISAFFGSAQNCLSKAAKYSVFDTTKDMAFIPLDHDVKLKGKAAIDGFGSRLGKSGGSIIHQILLLFFSTISASAPYVAAVILGAIAYWIHSVRSLGQEFATLVKKNNEEPLEEEEQPRQPSEPALSQT